ncbi:MAG: dTMP kinase [Sphingomonadaceae bacterium]
MSRGRFIAFEGGEGVGKSTQAQLLADALRKNGIDVAVTREPGGTAGAEAIRKLLLLPSGEGWEPRAEALLFAAARSDHVARLIRPSLENGEWVVCDRFIDSSRAYQGVALGLGDETIMDLHRLGSEGLLPDLVLVLQARTENVALRLKARDGATSDAIGGRDAAYHAKVNAAFAGFAHSDPGRYALVDGTGSIEQVHARVMQAVAPLIESSERC